MSRADQAGVIDVEQARAELEAVLSSEIFSKAPNQCRLLRYLCEHYFARHPEPLKEHQIAVEALGRKDDFDQRDNSIVRVEVHRVRKKLGLYYDREGRSRTLRIVIEPGQYAPRFVGAPAEADHGRTVKLLRKWRKAKVSPHARRFLLIGGSAALIVLVALAAWNLGFRRGAPASPGAAPFGLPVLPPNGSEVRILAGFPRSYHQDVLGHIWMGDRYFEGGKAGEAPREFIARVPDPTIYRYYRSGDFYYHIPLKPGVYELRLHFASGFTPVILTRQPGTFQQWVRINDVERELTLNFAADGAATSTADVRVFKDVSPDRDGKLHLHFPAYADFSFVNAIEITPGVRGRLLPIRIAAHEYFYTDHLGNIWPPDRYYRGGSIGLRRDAVQNSEDPDLYNCERFGTFDYLIPVAQGTYTVRLGFTEVWFGPQYPGAGGEGSRVFDVTCNGAVLAKNLDIFKEARGAGKVVFKTFRGVRPDAQGKLRLAFTPTKNNATVSTIEVIGE